jgi:O-antigen/teichoic acid export membrane protein
MWLGQVVLVRSPDGLVQAGYFAYAYRWYLLIMFSAAAIAPVGLSILTNIRATAGHAMHRRVLVLNLLVTLTVAGIPAALIATAAPWVTRLGGTGFTPATSTLLVLALACLVTALNTVISQAALSMDMTRAWIVSDVVLACVLAGTTFLLVPPLGSVGLAWAYLAGMVATCAVLIPPVIIRLNRPAVLAPA